MSTYDVRPHDERPATRIDWLDSKHSFSFGGHYDPANTHFGLLLVSNDDVVAPGSGFETHPHRDMEIVTWVLDGALVHQDSTGHNGVIYPGLAQRMSAGRGILHSEKNDAWRLDGARRPQRSRALRPDVGAAGRGRHRARLRAARHRCRAARAADWCRWRQGCPSTRTPPRSGSPRSDAALFAARLAPGESGRAAGGAVRPPLRRARIGRPRGRGIAGHRRRRTADGSRRSSGSPHGRGPPRSWSGRCTPPSPDPRHPS